MKRTYLAPFVMTSLLAGCSGALNGAHNALQSAASSSRLSQSGPVNWPVWGFSSSRSNYNNVEQTLTVDNVGELRAQWQTSLGKSPADAAPILLTGVGSSGKTMLFTTTRKGTTYAIDASTGQIVWQFATHGGPQTTSAPAADPSGTFIYAPGVDGYVHKLNAATGAEIVSGGFPVQVSLMPKSELDESPLNVANGYLYVTLGGSGSDHPPYDGHVVSVNLSTGAATIFNSLCSEYRQLLGPSGCTAQRSGIWSRGGAVVDPDPSMSGRIYVATGNGDFDANYGGYDFGDSDIALAPDLSSVLGSFTPTNYLQLDLLNHDLGSSSPALLPSQASSNTPLMLVQGGKDGLLRLMNRAPLPGVGGELHTLVLGRPLYSAPAVWTDPSGNAWVFIGMMDRALGFVLTTDGSGDSMLARRWSARPGRTLRGTSPVVANGIVFAAFNGALVALNAATGQQLWSSADPSAGVNIGNVHFESPIVVNGWVYCSDQGGNVTAYALPGSRSRRRYASGR